MKKGERVVDHDHSDRYSGGPIKGAAIVKGAGDGGGNAGVPQLSAVLSAGNTAANRPILGGSPFALVLAGGAGDTGDARVSLASGGGAEGVGGTLVLSGGASGPTDVGGGVSIAGGSGDDGNDPGASIFVEGGSGGGLQGDIEVSARYVILIGLPTADPGVPGALWVDGSNFLKVSP